MKAINIKWDADEETKKSLPKEIPLPSDFSAEDIDKISNYISDVTGFCHFGFDIDESNDITVLLVEPGKYPREVKIENTLETMQEIVGGYIEKYMPFDDEVAIICNEEGKMNGAELNRAIYSEPENVEMSYQQLKAHLQQAEKDRSHTVGYIVFTADSFDKSYTEEERTYVVSSNNKAFIEGMGGYSIYASSLDGSDKNVRLEAYMTDEYGGKDGWKIEKCYVKDESNREMLDIIAGKFFIAYAPIESEKFLSMPKALMEKYKEIFKLPGKFANDVVLRDFPEATVSNMKIKETDDRKIVKTSTTGTTGTYSYRT